MKEDKYKSIQYVFTEVLVYEKWASEKKMKCGAIKEGNKEVVKSSRKGVPFPERKLLHIEC